MVENSWGSASGYRGHLIMTDKWFDEYMFRVVAEKKYVPAKGAGYFKTETNPSSGMGPDVCRDEE